jgi:hypothetical protein
MKTERRSARLYIHNFYGTRNVIAMFPKADHKTILNHLKQAHIFTPYLFTFQFV